MTPQPLRALDCANDARLAAAALRQELDRLGGEHAVRRAIAVVRDPGTGGTLRCGRLVEALPGVGPVTVPKILRWAGVPHDARLRDLTPLQREALIDAVQMPACQQKMLRGTRLERQLVVERDALRERIAAAIVALNGAPAGATEFATSIRKALQP